MPPTMDLLPQIAISSNRAILSLAFPNAFSQGTTDSGPPASVEASAIASFLSSSLQRISIYLGPDLCALDDFALSSALQGIASRCPSLKSVSVTSYAETWTPNRASLVQGLIPPSIIQCTIRVVDPEGNSDASRTHRVRHSQVIQTFRASLPLGRIGEPSMAATLCGIQDLNELILLPPDSRASYLQDADKILAALTRELPSSRNLRKLSLPLDMASDLHPLLYIVSALPRCDDLEFSPPSIHTPSLFPIVAALNHGFDGFDHLRRVCLPAEALCDLLGQSLGALQGLQELKIVVMSSPISNDLSSPSVGQFRQLHTLEVIGSFSDLEKAIRAFVRRGENVLKRVYINAKCLSHRIEMSNAIEAMQRRCPGIRELGIRIDNVHPMERMDWVDLSQLHKLQLKDFVIQHPRPLTITDNDVRRLLTAWPRARYVSLNPLPSLGSWTTPSGTKPASATLNALIQVAERGEVLRHFGIHLNWRIPHALYQSHRPLPSLRRLDLGSSGCDKRTVALIKQLFPNARL
ncbi:hypothetical protein Hypma_012754 [Hypsizygus marmoreus]|uniref:F-box domain-containing protein n=1 Tax=Hypsizygus marmoreus TaxID=39966 RepID=A0A369JJL7_HYPMA|nr:hypothetical protein Hypma_012754 [Hypsizygus marmoreus]